MNRWWAIYIITLILAWTAPVDPLINRKYILLPAISILGVLGLISIYYATLPRRTKQ